MESEIESNEERCQPDPSTVMGQLDGDEEEQSTSNLPFPASNIWVVLPLLIEAAPTNVLVKFRTVSPSYRDELDHRIQSHPLNVHLAIENIEGINTPNLLTIFPTDAALQMHIQDLLAHPRNPFIGRKLELGWPELLPLGANQGEIQQLLKRFFANLRKVLIRFGDQIDSAVFNIRLPSRRRVLGMRIYTQTCYDPLLSFLTELCNLKKLTVRGSYLARTEHVQGFYSWNQLPRLEQLETVELCMVDVESANAILGFCCVPTKIKRLSIENRHDGLNFRTIRTFVNLEILKICVLYGNLSILRSLEQSLPIRELHIKYVSLEQWEVFPFTYPTIRFNSLWYDENYVLLYLFRAFPSLQTIYFNTTKYKVLLGMPSSVILKNFVCFELCDD
ncbi:unnamed protein product [Orchesella dallaii]|uniref:Uncharacterized protein n=1 Tax=Orchesella dallaii TaxID=48710 RepID=A0ABP1R1J6_9HEXA